MSEVAKYSPDTIDRSLLPSNSKHTQRYRITRKNRSVSQSNQFVSHSQLLNLCEEKNYQQIDEAGIRLENNKLRFALRKINNSLTKKVEKKKMKMESSQYTSMKELMEYVPQNIQDDKRKNQQIIDQLIKQLQGYLIRRKVLSNLQYRTNIQNETSTITSLVEQMVEDIRSIKRKFLLTQKQIKEQQKKNEGKGYFDLRSEMIRISQHVQEVQNKLVEVQMQNTRVLQKLLIASEKQLILKASYQYRVKQQKQSKDNLTLINQSNEVYLQNLTRLKNSKRRCNTVEQMYKVKYYQALKRLDIQSQKHSKVDDQIRQIQYQIFLKKQFAERLGNKLQAKNKKSFLQFQEDDIGKGLMITEISDSKGSKRNRKNKHQRNKTLQSQINYKDDQQNQNSSLYY